MSAEHAGALSEPLGEIESACAAYDAGDRREGARRIAAALRAIFDASTSTGSLLARAGGAFVPLLSTNVKSPADNTGGCWPGLVAWDLDPANSILVCKPRLDNGRAGHRPVAPEFWWKSEAIYTRDHHHKVRRRDLALALAGAAPDALAWLAEPIGWKTTYRTADASTRTVNVFGATEASLRQVAHEVLGSKDLLKLAGR